MQVTKTSNNIIDIVFDPNVEGLCLLDFVLIEEGSERFLAQVTELADDKFDANLNLAKIQIFYSINERDEIVEYNGFTPTRTCKITLCNQREIEDFINTDKKVFELSLNPKTMLPLKFNLNFFENNPIILADKMEDFNILSSNLAHVLSNFKNVVIFDYTGSLDIKDCTRLRAGIDFRLPLDYFSLDYIWEDAMEKATLEVQAVCEDIFNEVKAYAKSLKGKSIPFPLFLKVIREQYKQTPLKELWYLRNKLIKYQQKQLFAKNLKDIEVLGTAIKNDKITVIDFSHIEVSWHKAFCEFILRAVKQNIYLFMRLNESTSSTDIINQIYGKNTIKVIPSSSYGYKKLPSIAEHCNNYIFLPTLNPVRNYGPANSAVWTLDSNYALLFGDDTKDFIFKIQNTINLDEEIGNRKKARRIKLKSLQKYSEKFEKQSEPIVEEKVENKIVVENEPLPVEPSAPDEDFDMSAFQKEINEESLKEEIFAAPIEDIVSDAQIQETSQEISYAPSGEIVQQAELEDLPTVEEDNTEEDFQNLLLEEEQDEKSLPKAVEQEVPQEDISNDLSDEERDILGVMGDDELDFYENENNEIDYEQIVKNTQVQEQEISSQEDVVTIVPEDLSANNDFVVSETLENPIEETEQEMQQQAVQQPQTNVETQMNDIPDLELVDELPLEDLSLDLDNLSLETDEQSVSHEAEVQQNTIQQEASVSEEKANFETLDLGDGDDISLEDLMQQAQEEMHVQETQTQPSQTEEVLDDSDYDVIDLSADDIFDVQRSSSEIVQQPSQTKDYSEIFDITATESETSTVSTPKATGTVKAEFREGEVVKHEKYGIGKVLEVILYSNRSLLQIEFADIGKRLLDPKIANIKHLSDK